MIYHPHYSSSNPDVFITPEMKIYLTLTLALVPGQSPVEGMEQESGQLLIDKAGWA